MITPQSGNLSQQAKFSVGQKVFYYSNSHKKWLVAFVERDNQDGTIDLDVRPKAYAASISATCPPGFKEVASTGASSASDDDAAGNALTEFGTDMVKKAESGAFDPLVGRDLELRKVMQILSRKTKNNPILVGESGVGKTKIVQGLAQMMADQVGIPPSLQGKRIISIDVGQLVAGASYKGEFEDRVQSVLKAAESSNGKVILFLDDIHLVLAGSSKDSGMNAADLIKPALSSGAVTIIGVADNAEFKKVVLKDQSFERRFQPVEVLEPAITETVEILKGLRSIFEQHHDINIAVEALEDAAKLSHRYVAGRFLPDKAIDCLDEACASLRIELDENPTAENMVNAKSIARVISSWTRIPLEKLNISQREKLLNLDKEMAKRVLGQDEAVRNIADAIVRARANLNRANGPLGSFLFLGPTGVGKTEICKALAEQLFDDDEHMVRLDMSEYMQPFSITRMIGAPPGYAGYEEGGQLTEAVRKNPYTVVLFDEVEKAHVNVFNLLLQVLDDGRLTDGQGRTINFSNTIIILTSNLGASEIAKSLYDDPSEEGIQRAREGCLQGAKDHFRPEFLNRLDSIVFFKPLPKALLRTIVVMQLANLGKRLEDRDISLHMTDEAVDVILDRAYSPEYGARPIRRYLEKNVGTALSKVLIAEDLPSCDIWLLPGGEDGEEGITDDCPLTIEIRDKQ